MGSDGIQEQGAFITLYADKTRLSSFGTTQGYPVYARCANLPHEIRNGMGLGGGVIVGWLPIVIRDAITLVITST